MRIKDLFSVPEGTKVTEKAFGRVLTSSICSIVLCMACLAGTSWAWFTAGVDSTIQIDIAPVSLETTLIQTVSRSTVDPLVDGSYCLSPGEYKLQLALNREQPKSTAYVLVTIRHSDPANDQAHYFTFTGNEKPQATLTVVDGTAEINFLVTWVAPDSAGSIPDGSSITVGRLPAQTEDPTGSTTESTQGADGPQDATQPGDMTQPADPGTEDPAQPNGTQQPDADQQNGTQQPDATQPEAQGSTPAQPDAGEN